MIIARSESKTGPLHSATTVATRVVRLRSVQWVAAAIAGVVLLFVGATLARVGVLPTEGLESAAKEAVHGARYLAAHMSAPPDTLRIDIKFLHYKGMLEQRSRALELGFIPSEARTYVPAQIRYQKKRLKAKVRLKGDQTDHLDTDKWSFRVSLKGQDRFRGMKRFSVQHPKTRHYVYEWLYLNANRREGILAPRYDFVSIVLNGTRKGIYALEEAFSQEFMELHRRRESVIVRLNEDMFWLDALRCGTFTGPAVNWQSSRIEPFGEKKVSSSPLCRGYFQAARTLLDRFRRGELATSEALDAGLLARYFALADLLGAWHATAWHNIRFYYNPITSKLEPVAFDGDAGQPISRVRGVAGSMEHRLWYAHTIDGGSPTPVPGRDPNDTIHRAVFRDMDFYRLYVRELERVSGDGYLNALEEELSDGLSRKLDILHREWPSQGYDPSIFRGNRDTIRSALHPVFTVDAYVRSRSASPGQPVHIRGGVGNLLPMPVEVVGLLVNGHDVPVPEPLRLLPAKLSSHPTAYGVFDVTLPPAPQGAAATQTVVVRHRILGASEDRTVVAEERPALDISAAPVGDADALARLRRCAFIDVRDGEKEIRIRPGTWFVDRDLVAPAGYRVAAGPGTTLAFAEGAALVSYSPVHFVGTQGKPVRLHPRGENWDGLVVLRARERSRLEWVEVERTRSVARTTWMLTGGVTFYRSPVEMAHCTFQGALAEDSINLIESPFVMRSCRVSDAASDGLDADFSDGVVADCTFERTGNDGLDVSGSRVQVRRFTAVACGDKAISAGEHSTLTCEHVIIRDCHVAVASKDLSMVTLRHAGLTRNKVGLAAYRKKAWFGPACITAESTESVDNATPVLVETRSEVRLNGQLYLGDQKNVADRLAKAE